MSKKNYMEVQEEILDKVGIVDFISKYVTLRKKGANYTGLCPFHEEKTPSFIVSPYKGIYKCFGCGRGGYLINFYMEQNKVEWKEAIEDIAKMMHIDLGPGYDSAEQNLLQRHRDMLKITEQFYHNKVGKIRDFIHSRGITDESIETYKLGYSGNDRKQLMNHLYTQGFTIEEMFSQGLIIGDKHNLDTTNLSLYFERFTDRWMFPLYDEKDRIVGFSGRILPECEDKQRVPKYLNSPESDLYHKSEILYGLNIIKNDLLKNKQAYTVEGYTDVIMLHQQGIPAVGKAGTGLSPVHIRKLARYVKKVFVVGDNDAEDINAPNPGLTAARRDFPLFMNQGISTYAIVLPPKEDPASFFQKYTKADFDNLERLNLAKVYIKTTDISNPDKKTEVLEHIVQELSYIEDPLKKYLWIKEVATLIGIPEVFIAKKYTADVNTEIKEDNKIDYFGSKFVNSLASLFVARLLLTPAKFAMPYLRDVPIAEIPHDGSIFSSNMLDFYTKLNNEFSMQNYQLSLFGMDIKNISTNLLIDEHKQVNFRSTRAFYSISNNELGWALAEIMKTTNIRSDQKVESNKNSISENTNSKIESDTSHGYDLDTLARLLRSEILLKKQNVLMSKISEGVLSGIDISELFVQVEKLNHRL